MTLRLLLVEDDDIDREAVLRALREGGDDIDVVCAETVRGGSERLREARVDCILSDLTLPDGEGLDLLPHAQDAPLVVLTGGADDRAREALRRGAQDYLLKDQLDPHWLRRAVHYAIERKRLSTRALASEHQDRLASLGHLAASIAHEINNPIAFVGANVETLQRWWHGIVPGTTVPIEDALHEDFVQLLAETGAGLERVASIVGQLRSFGRRSEDHEPLEQASLAEVAEWAIALTRTRITHAAELRVDTTGSPGPFVGRPGRIAQVLTNLLLNATQAAEQGSRAPQVRLTVRGDGAHSIAEVEDSGPGLPPELRDRVFEPFFTTKPAGEGTGLGLPISHDIVVAHDGSLELSDSVLGGLRAVVRLPARVLGESDVHLTDAGEIAETDAERWTLLIIDDEPSLRRAFARMLRPHEVHAMDGAGALEWLAADGHAATIDAIICDVMMPGVDGVQVHEALSERHPGLAKRFVFCSGGAFRPDLARYLAASAVPVLLKPVSRAALVSALRPLLRERQAATRGYPSVG